MVTDHPALTDHKLVLVDTEGIGDPKKVGIMGNFLTWGQGRHHEGSRISLSVWAREAPKRKSWPGLLVGAGQTAIGC